MSAWRFMIDRLIREVIPWMSQLGAPGRALFLQAVKKQKQNKMSDIKQFESTIIALDAALVDKFTSAPDDEKCKIIMESNDYYVCEPISDSAAFQVKQQEK